MIVVVGSRHDPTARSLADAWPAAALCSVEDLTQPGWVWSTRPETASTWVVEGTPVSDDKVTGVFVRRTTVYPEELVRTHPDDRIYLAAEAHAFLVFVLGVTRATVVNPVADGALGEEILRPERWMRAATCAGLSVAPIRLTDKTVQRRRSRSTAIEVVGDRAFGDASESTIRAALALTHELALRWATLLFDGRSRLVHITCATPPGALAVEALGRMLAKGKPS